MKYKEIIQIANSVKNYVEKNKKIPSTITNNNITYTWQQTWYILSWGVLNLNKELKSIPKPKSSDKATGEKINENIYPNDYKDQAKRIVQFINENGKAPNYVTSVKSKKKISPYLSLYANAKIIVWYSNKNIIPMYCNYNSNVFTKNTTTTNKTITTTKTKSKYGHATKEGCDNMGQNTSYYCACHSLQEVIRNLYNIVIPQKTLASIMGTTSSGTDHEGIKTAVAWFNKKYNKNMTVTEKYFSDLNVEGIKKIINSSNQDLIIHLAYKRIYGHYEVVNNINGNTWNIQNSLGSKCGKCYCGYKESRPYSTEKSWIDAKSGVKSILIFTRK